MKVIKIIIICIGVIVGLVLIASSCLYLYNKCTANIAQKTFLTQYEFEDFSQFKGTQMFFRGFDDEGYKKICGFTPAKQYDYKNTHYFIILIKESDFRISYNHTFCDTTYIIDMVKQFLKYNISALDVDTIGNCMIDVEIEDRAFVRFANENEMLKRSKEMKWIKVKENWYKPQY